MNAYTAHFTPHDGIARRIALIAFDYDDAKREAQLLGASLFGRGFSFNVWAA